MDLVLSGKECDEFVAVERREFGGVPKRVADEFTPTVEATSLPGVINLPQKRFGDFEVCCDDLVLIVIVCSRFRRT